MLRPVIKHSLIVGVSSFLVMAGALLMPVSAKAASHLNGLEAEPQIYLLEYEPYLPLQEVQYIYGGQSYCFYFNGWHGPGWYWCGYAFCHGYGWGGPSGYRGWGRPHGRPGAGYERHPGGQSGRHFGNRPGGHAGAPSGHGGRPSGHSNRHN